MRVCVYNVYMSYSYSLCLYTIEYKLYLLVMNLLYITVGWLLLLVYEVFGQNIISGYGNVRVPATLFGGNSGQLTNVPSMYLCLYSA